MPCIALLACVTGRLSLLNVKAQNSLRQSLGMLAACVIFLAPSTLRRWLERFRRVFGKMKGPPET